MSRTRRTHAAHGHSGPSYSVTTDATKGQPIWLRESVRICVFKSCAPLQHALRLCRTGVTCIPLSTNLHLKEYRKHKRKWPFHPLHRLKFHNENSKVSSLLDHWPGEKSPALASVPVRCRSERAIQRVAVAQRHTGRPVAVQRRVMRIRVVRTGEIRRRLVVAEVEPP